MLYFQECRINADLDTALEATKDFPAFLNVHYSIKSQRLNEFPEVYWRTFWWSESQEAEKLCIVAKIYRDYPVRSFLILCHRLEAKFDQEALWDLFDEIARLLPSLYKTEGPVTISYGDVATTYQKWFHARYPSMELKQFPCNYYYMTPEQQKQLVEDFKDGVPLPQGYYFDEADLEKDTQTIFETWIHAQPGDYETTKAKLRNMPSSLVREGATHKPVAFEMTDACGFLNHLYTLPEHRGKGIGSAVEYDLCLKLIKNGITPFKDVELYNKSVIASSDKSKYWSRWDKDGKPVLMIFHKHSEKVEN